MCPLLLLGLLLGSFGGVRLPRFSCWDEGVNGEDEEACIDSSAQSR